MFYFRPPLFLIAVLYGVQASHETSFTKQLTVFSPKGRLYQVEYALAASTKNGSPCLAMHTDYGTVAAACRPRRSTLAHADAYHSIFSVSHRIGCTVSGLPGDVMHQVGLLRKHASRYQAEYGHEIPVRLLALYIANDAQRCTQQTPRRPLGSTVILFGAYGVPQHPENIIYRVEPTGQLFVCKAAAAGRNCDAASVWLEKALQELPSPPCASAQDDSCHSVASTLEEHKARVESLKELVVDYLKHVNAIEKGRTLQARDIEVVVCNHGVNGGFSKLADDELERLLVRSDI